MKDEQEPYCALSDNPLFSVLIANYNNGKYIAEALDSVIKQTYESWEIIIVDDSSTDNSIEIITPYLKNERIKLFVNDENGGCGFTKKRCVDEAAGELCGYLDPDDALLCDALEIMVGEFKRYPDSGIINSRNHYCDHNLTPTEVNPYSKEVPNNGPYIFYNDGSITHFAVFRRDHYLQTDGLSPFYTKAVDQDLYLLLDQTGPIRFIDKILYYYRIHKGGISTFENVIPATYQHFKILQQSSFKQLQRIQDKDYRKKLNFVFHRSNFHLAMLEKKRLKSIYLLGKYALNGGIKEVKGMFGRLIKNPGRVMKTISKTYTIKKH